MLGSDIIGFMQEKDHSGCCVENGLGGVRVAAWRPVQSLQKPSCIGQGSPWKQNQ